jgi:L-fuconolactonase
MPILDSQVHAYERNHPGRPWNGTLYGPIGLNLTGVGTLATMSSCGGGSWQFVR